MKQISVLLLLATLTTAGAKENLIAVLQTGDQEISVDTVALTYDVITETVPTPDFGGAAGLTDTFSFVFELAPKSATVWWLGKGERQPPLVIDNVVPDSWYLFPTDDPSQIKFLLVESGIAEQPGNPAVSSPTLSPNPTSGRAVLSAGGFAGAAGLVGIYRPDGRRVVAKSFGIRHSTFDIPLDLSALADGIYLVRLTAGTRSASTRLVVAR